uniref:Trafficking protein particle complex subunit 8 n=1 Tax=Panagrellus redivivus TaxID=6233 RepID=A0A7E4V638_PANRE
MAGTAADSSSNDVVISRCGLSPLVAVLPSPGADAICKKNNVASFADLLAPFSSVTFVIKDPFGQNLSSRVRIDFRDITKSGSLLGFTVLPSVLEQVVASLGQSQLSEEVWDAGFRDAFCYWLEPAENDFLKTYLACLFVVSAEEEDPLSSLAKLVQQQNHQQHGSGAASDGTPIGAAHCTPPRWFLPNTLKAYVLLHDVSTGDEAKATETFARMASTYGSENCHILKINSTCEDDLPDPWAQILKDRYRGLDAGLDVARRNLLAKASEANNDGLSPDSLKPLSIMPIAATISSSSPSPVFSTSSAAANPTVPLASTLPSNGPISPSAVSPSSAHRPSVVSLASLSLRQAHGQCLATSDREQIRDFVDHFTKTSLIPFVEKQISLQNEILQNRRGIAKSFTSVRKWFSVASSSATATPTAPVNYGPESAEIQTRRLADLAFLFGLYTFAHQLYQSIKKDFANDQAWLYHAGALEMAAITFYLSSSQLSPKQFPLHYFVNALNYYANTCMQPMLALRCAIFSTEVLSRVNMNLDAANQLIRLTSGLSNHLYCAVLLEKAAKLFQLAKMHRRRAFHLVLAGHRFNEAGLPELSLNAYDNAAPEYFERGWAFAEDHIMFTLSHESKDPTYQVDCATKLVRPGSAQYVDQQKAFIEQYLSVLTRTTKPDSDKKPSLVLPLVEASSVRVIHGEVPETLPPLGSTKRWEPPLKDAKDPLSWEDLERAGYHAAVNSNKKCESPLFSDDSTNNTSKKETPPFERFRVQMKLTNPMNVPLFLRNIKLGVSEATLRDESPADLSLFTFQSIRELVLQATDIPTHTPGLNPRPVVEPSETLIELNVIPNDAIASFTIGHIEFELANVGGTVSVAGILQLNIRGKHDHRLSATVSAQRWPLLNISLSGQAARSDAIHAYCSQIFQVMVTLENVGVVDVNRITVSTDVPEYIGVSEASKADAPTPWQLAEATMNSNGVLVHTISPEIAKVPVGGKITLRLGIRAPEEVVTEKQYRLLFIYATENGHFREYRYSVKLSTQPLLRCMPKVLKHNAQLCAVEVKNLVPFRDAVLAKVEILRLSAVFTKAPGSANPKDADAEDIEIGVEPVLKRSIQIECDQSDILPFYLRATSTGSSSLLLTDSLPDIPAFNNPISHELKLATAPSQADASPSRVIAENHFQRGHLRLTLLWKAHIANTDGTVATLFGESWVVNPFGVNHLNKVPLETTLEEPVVFYITGIPELNGRFSLVLTDQDRTALLAARAPNYSSIGAPKQEIPWCAPVPQKLEDEVADLRQTVIAKLSSESGPTIIHDVKSGKLCTFTATLTLKNSDPLRRTVVIAVHTCIAMGDMRSPIVVDTIYGLPQTQQRAPSSQPQLTCDRGITRRVLAFGATTSVQLKFKANRTFGYNLAEVVGAEATFEGTETVPIRLEIPATYVFVKSPKLPTPVMSTSASRESTTSPAFSHISNDSLGARFPKARVSS